jgi:hypothetical protein
MSRLFIYIDESINKKEVLKMSRQIRSDIKIGNLEKKLGLENGAIRNPNGTDARSDKQLGTLRKEYQK